MKLICNLTIFLLVLGAAASCSSKSALTTLGEPVINSILSEQDTVEYELLIIDPAFDIWYQRNYRPEGFYSLEYLEYWNRRLVLEWNTKINWSHRIDCMPVNTIQYNPDSSYGISLNHKLFFYFRYFQEQCKFFDIFPRER